MKRFFIFLIIIAAVIAGVTFAIAKSGPDTKPQPAKVSDVPVIPSEPAKPAITHITTPTPVRALYMSSWIASSSKSRQHILDLVELTDANAIVLDIKDATGRVSFKVSDPVVADTGSPENRIRDIVPFIQELHDKNIYVIGRISTFQDPYLTKLKPDWAVTKKSDGTVWKDRKGLSFLDPANKHVWDYTVALAKASYEVGFDEINFDYVRYPSDGNVKDINYRLAEGKTRADNVEAFFAYLRENVTKEKPIVMSADLFGLTTTEKTDMGIGQILEKALPHFDYIGPMVYPSHYADFAGFKNPAEHPYEVILKSLKDAQAKIDAMHADPNLSQAVKDHVKYSQIRPWLQDFSIGTTKYDAAKVKAQIQATYDAGLDSWMMWDPSNKYTEGAYAKQ